MKEKKVLIVAVIIICVILLIPAPIQMKDGSMQYKAILYNITKIYRPNEQSPTGRENGWDIQILGFRVYYQINDHSEDKTIDSNKQKKDNSDDMPVTMHIKDGTLTPKGATFILKNNTDKEYSYEPSYYLEKKENENWEKIELDEPLSWNTVIYNLKPREETEINIDWLNTGYGVLNKGQYRLSKPNFREKDSPSSIGFETHTEFEIK